MERPIDPTIRQEWRPMLQRLTIPVTIVATLFLIKVMYPGLADTDFYWHLKTGEYIVSTRSVPQVDLFSHTFLGKSWVLHEWLSEVILYLTMNWFGFAGVAVLAAGMFAATFFVLFRLVSRLVPDEMKAMLASLLFFVPNVIFFPPRPQMFSFFLFSCFLTILVEYKYFGETRRFKFLPLLMLVWVNLHAVFIVGIALLAMFLLTEWASLRLSRSGDARRWRGLRHLAMVSACTLLVTAINPQFFQLWLYPFQVVTMDAAQSLISEWRSPDFHLKEFKYFLLLIIGFFVMLIYSRRKPDLTELAIPICFIVAGMTALRHLPLMSIALLPFFASFYGDRVKASAPATTAGGIDRLVPVLNAGMLAIVAMLATLAQLENKTELAINASLPVKAADFILRSGISGNMLNNYDDGGYLIYRLGPGRKVFIDGRGDMYGDEFMKKFIGMYGGAAGWKEQFEKFSIDFVVCRKDAAIRQLLLADGSFREAHQDAVYSVLLRAGPGAPGRGARP
jgi:hypothetical protein